MSNDTELTMGVGAQLPRYKCHKEVFALKIKSIEIVKATVEELETILKSETVVEFEILPSGEVIGAGADESTGAIITPEHSGFAPFPVSRSYCRKHNPKPGGYYVVYTDGYKSFSPAKAFEEGYTLITGDPA